MNPSIHRGWGYFSIHNLVLRNNPNSYPVIGFKKERKKYQKNYSLLMVMFRGL